MFDPLQNAVTVTMREEGGGGGEEECIHVIGGKDRRKEPPGNSRHKWVHNIKMDIGEIEWGGMDWNDLV
jgi:hypothetical protein